MRGREREDRGREREPPDGGAARRPAVAAGSARLARAARGRVVGHCARTLRGAAAGQARRAGALLPFARPQERAFSRYAEHQATEEARPHRRRAAAREPALPLDDQDAHEAPRDHGRGRRRATVEEEHKALVKLIDRAVARGALHRNAGARKKSQAARPRRPARARRRPRASRRRERRLRGVFDDAARLR